MNYKGFSVDAFNAYVQRFGFESIDHNAMVKMVLTIRILIQNMLNNVCEIANPLSIKTLKKEHFEAVMGVIKSYLKQTGQKNGVMQGGHQGYVLPSEYFGKESGRYTAMQGGHQGYVLPHEYYGQESGRYFSPEHVSSHEGTSLADGYTRPPLEIKVPDMLGGSKDADAILNKKLVKQIIDDYKESRGLTFKMSTSAYNIIIACVMGNIDALMKVAKQIKQKKKLGRCPLSLDLIFTSLEADKGQRFLHMSQIVKRKN